jgi:hypothetical protein
VLPAEHAAGMAPADDDLAMADAAVGVGV